MERAIGIDFGGTSIKPAVVVGSQIIETLPRLITSDYKTSDELLVALGDLILETTKKHPDIAAVGIGVPGFVNFPEGVINDLPNVKGWQNVPMQAILEKHTGLHVKIENDVNAMCYAEWKYGAGKGCENLVAMTLGTGLGGGLIINNQIVRGHNYVASEIGHITVDRNGQMGQYNNPGGVETYIGNQAITAYAQERYAEAGQNVPIEECDPLALYNKANEGDEIALGVWEFVAENLASVISTLCWALNPEKIILGGGTANAGKFLFTPVKEKVFGQLSHSHQHELQIIPAHFKNDAGKIGAAQIALDSLRERG